MIEFNTTSFGKVVVNGETYGDVLVIKNEVIERDRRMLEERYKTSHLIAPEEIENLLSSEPEIVIIGTGQYGALIVSPKVIEKFEKNKVKLTVLKTPQAIREYNKLKKANKKVNALIHVTC